MTTTEELIVEYLNDRAREATVEFTIEDVERGTLPVSLVDRPRRSDRRARLMGAAVAAGVALIVGTVILRAGTDSPSRFETEPAVEPDGAASTDSELPGTPLALSELDEPPRLLGAGAVVMQAEAVGRVELGLPSDALLAAEPWLAHGRCITTALVTACAGAADSEQGYTATFGSSSSDGFHVVKARETPDGPFVGYSDPAGPGVVMIADLPIDTAMVQADLGAGLLRQEPLGRAAVFPFTSDGAVISLRAIDGEGSLLWSATIEGSEPTSSGPAPLVSIELSASQLDDTAEALHVGSAAHNAGHSVAVGWVMESDRSRAAIWWSDDGANWTRVEQDDELFGPPTQAPVELFDVVATADGFVAVGGNEEFIDQERPMVWRSDDGTTWTRIPPDPDINSAYMQSITAFEGGFVAVGLAPNGDGASAAVWRSDDGLDWGGAVRPAELLSDITSVPTASGSVLFAIGGGSIHYSADAINWVRARSTSSDNMATLPGIGVIIEDSEGRAIASSDGVTWTQLALARAEGESVSVRAAAGSAELAIIYGATYLPASDPSTCGTRSITGTWLWASTDGGDSWQQLQLDSAPSSGLGILLDIGDQILSVTSATSLIDKAQIATALTGISTVAGIDTEPGTTAGQDSTSAASSCP